MTEQPLSPVISVEQILRRLSEVVVTVFGDFCLDAYWTLDEGSVEHSIETGLPLQRVRAQRYSLGGAGNVVANLAAMGVKHVRAVGVVGEDMFGGTLARLLRDSGADTSALIASSGLDTTVYAKPCAGLREGPRFDFGAFNVYPETLIDAALDKLRVALAASHVVILNQQLPGSLSQPSVIGRINELIRAHERTFCLVDARHFADCYSGGMLKLNTEEAARLLGEPTPGPKLQDRATEFAKRLYDLSGKPCFITCGEHGLLSIDEGGTLVHVPAVPILGPVDTVGAGDSVIAGLAAALASGSSVHHAAEFANLIASVTVQQLHCTGTASPQQILAAAQALERDWPGGMAHDEQFRT